MTVPNNAHEVGAQLAKLAKTLDAAKESANHAELDEVEAREAFKVAEAKALLRAEGGTADQRRAQATLDTHDERLKAETATAISKGWGREIRTIQARIDIGRTLASGIRAEAQLAPYGGGA